MTTSRPNRIARPALFTPGAFLTGSGLLFAYWTVSLFFDIHSSGDDNAAFGYFIILPFGAVAFGLLGIGVPLIVSGLKPERGSSANTAPDATDES